MKKNNKKDFDNKNLIGNTDNVESQNDLSNGFDDLMYDSLDGDYQYFDGNEFDEVEEKAEKSASEEYLIAETQENIILPEVEGAEIALVEDNRPIKVREIAVQSDTTKVNAFDLFFLRLWAGMVSLLGYTANGINYIFYKIFKHKLPVKYIKAFLVALVIILLLIMILVPATANSQPKSKGDGGLVVFESNMIPVQVRVDDGSGDPVYKWGYLEKKKASTGTKDSLKIPAIYEEALPFNRYDIAWVRVRDEKGHYWQLINKNGKRVGDRMYAVSNSLPIGVRPFGEFTDSKLAWVNENGKFGYIDIKGNVKINCDLDVAGDFIEAIYDSYPFSVYGEGKKIKNKAFNENLVYGKNDYRFTYKTGCIYVFPMQSKLMKTYKIKSLKFANEGVIRYDIKKVEILGYENVKVDYKRDKKCMTLNVLSEINTDMPICFKITID